MVMIYPHTIRYGQSNQPGEYDVAHDPTYIYTPGVARAFEAFEAFGGFEALQTAALNAQKKPCCGRGVPWSHCCGFVVSFVCGSGACWACWGTFSLRSWADLWRVWSV